MAFALRCPDCRKTFRWNPDKPFPDECLLCGASMPEDKSDDGVVMPFIRSAATSSHDKVYRDIERSSEVRAEKAAAELGVPVSEMNDLKITNLNPTTHAGDIAAVPVNNAVSQHMDAMNAKGGKFGFSGGEGLGFSAGTATGAISVNGQVTQGIAPRAGANALIKTQRMIGNG